MYFSLFPHIKISKFLWKTIFSWSFAKQELQIIIWWATQQFLRQKVHVFLVLPRSDLEWVTWKQFVIAHIFILLFRGMSTITGFYFSKLFAKCKKNCSISAWHKNNWWFWKFYWTPSYITLEAWWTDTRFAFVVPNVLYKYEKNM